MSKRLDMKDIHRCIDRKDRGIDRKDRGIDRKDRGIDRKDRGIDRKDTDKSIDRKDISIIKCNNRDDKYNEENKGDKNNNNFVNDFYSSKSIEAVKNNKSIIMAKLRYDTQSILATEIFMPECDYEIFRPRYYGNRNELFVFIKRFLTDELIILNIDMDSINIIFDYYTSIYDVQCVILYK